MTTSTLYTFTNRTIPASLKTLPQWVCWRAELREGKTTKVPVNPVTREAASSTNPDTWTDYKVACVAAEQFDLGIGFVFTPDDSIIGVDLDKCRNAETGMIEPWARTIIDRLNSYTEISPSETGFHIYVTGILPTGTKRRGHIEMYDRGRYFTVTGQHLPDTPQTIEDRSVELRELHAELFPVVTTKTQATSLIPPSLSDEEILSLARKASNQEKFTRLWVGNWEGLYESQSEADSALCCHLAFYTKDAGQVDRLFRRSGLMRSKWDELHGESTYGERTINNALNLVTETYTPSAQNGQVAISQEDDPDTQPAPCDDLGTFPEAAWRGPFQVYREAMDGTSEAPDTAHFTSLWAVAAACLRRRVSFYYAFTHYPNVYLVNYGNTGDSKTSAGRQGLRLLPDQGVKVLRGVGSAEALGDWMQQPDEGPKVSHLMVIEELATLLIRGGWEGSTLLSFLTETFDTPDRYEIPFRKNPVLVEEPTPTLVAGTTIEWFWKGMREIDVHGGFGNRIFFMTGTPKPPIPLPAKPTPEIVAELRTILHGLQQYPVTELFLTPEANALWAEFYHAWKGTSWPELTTAAIKRIPAYIIKLSMVYACLEKSPLITKDQLQGAIMVGNYGAKCADRLMNRHRQHTVQGKCENRVLHVLQDVNLPTWKIHRRISGSYTAEELARAIRALVSTGAILEASKTQRGEPIYGRRDRRREV